MKKLISFSVLALLLLNCMTTSSEKEHGNKIIPDKTPFVSGILDFSNDTTHYYPQVVVGYVSDARFIENYRELKNITGLFSPTHLAQIVQTLRRFQLQFYLDSTALVQVTGPLNSNDSKTIEFELEKNSVYGDVKSQLKVSTGESYRLNVELSDGRKFESITYIPEEVNIQVPDSISLNVELKHFEDGTPREVSDPHYWTYFDSPENTFISETQKNTSIDRELLFLEPWESFLYSDRGSYLRTGISYGAWISNNTRDSVQTGWWITLTEPWFHKDLTINQWRRFSFYSDGMWRNHQPLSNYIVPFGDWEEVFHEYGEASSNKDSTYLKEYQQLMR